MNHPPISNDALSLHRDALVWDMTLPIITPGSPERKQSLLRRAAAAGFDYISITLAVDLYDFRAAATELARHRAFVAEHGDVAVLADSTAAIGEARAAGRLAIGFSFQGTAPFESELGFVDLFYELGVRHALMAYNDHNLVGSGCHVAADEGLTAYGRELVAEMNRVGMVVDCAHTGYRTTMETIEASTSPVIISHTNARALTDHPRCVRDDQIEACAASGGVVGMTGLNIFLGGEATPRRLVDHIDHVAGLVGPEHVGLGAGLRLRPGDLPGVHRRLARAVQPRRQLLQHGPDRARGRTPHHRGTARAALQRSRGARHPRRELAAGLPPSLDLTPAQPAPG